MKLEWAVAGCVIWLISLDTCLVCETEPEVVTLHMALDRLLFARVILGLTVLAGARANVPRITRRVSKMRFAARLDLAQDAGWISEELADDVAAVNGLRNRLLHYDVKRGVEAAPEIASPEAFGAFTERAIHAWSGLADDLMPLFEQAQGRPGEAPASPS